MKLYDLYDREHYIGAFTAREISEMTDYEARYIPNAARLGYKLKRRYKIEPTDDHTLSKKDWLLLEDFTYLTEQIKKQGKIGGMS